MMPAGAIGGLVIGSLLAAFVLTSLQFPDSIAAFRPAFVAITVMFWTLVLPRQFGLLMAWCTGLGLDALIGTVLGQHALALLLVSYCLQRLNEVMRNFTVAQQTLTVLPLFMLYEFMLFWVDGMTGRDTDMLARWLPVISSTALWPLACSMQRRLLGSTS